MAPSRSGDGAIRPLGPTRRRAPVRACADASSRTLGALAACRLAGLASGVPWPSLVRRVPWLLCRRLPLALSRFARRASRNFRISTLGRSLCLAQTIPKTGAARFVHPGTGHSWIGAFCASSRRSASDTGQRQHRAAARRPEPGGRPRRLPFAVRLGASPPENADMIASRARATASCSISAESWPTKSPTMMSDLRRGIGSRTKKLAPLLNLLVFLDGAETTLKHPVLQTSNEPNVPT